MTADVETGDPAETGAERTARELADDRRIARLRQALNGAIEATCATEPDMTFGDVVDALTGVSHRYAQHLRRTDVIPVALPADVEMLCLAPGVGPDGLYDAERFRREFLRAAGRPPVVLGPCAQAAPAGHGMTGLVAPGDTVTCTVGMPLGLPPGTPVTLVDQDGRPVAAGLADAAGELVWQAPLPPASGVQISGVVPAALGEPGMAALAAAARALAWASTGDLVVVAADAAAGLFSPGAEVIVTGDAGEQNVYGFVVAVAAPLDAQLVDEPERPPLPDAAPAFTTIDRRGGLCGRCGSPEHRTPACDADDFTAAAWLGKD